LLIWVEIGFPLVVAAQNVTAPVPASTFWHEGTKTQFSVNVANDSSDIFIYFASPAYSWVGFGFGQKMEHSLMLIMYPNDKGNSMFPFLPQHQLLQLPLSN